VKRILIVLLLLLCAFVVIGILNNNELDSESSSGLAQPGASNQTLFTTQPFEQMPTGHIPNNNNDSEDKIMTNESRIYKVGVDIPAGIYMAANDGSNISRVTIRDSFEPVTETPNIIVTARFLSDNSAFADRTLYAEAVRKGGGVPVMPEDDSELAGLLSQGLIEYAEALADRYDGLLLTGGGDIASHFYNQEHHPASNPPDEVLDRAELALAHAFIDAGKPILGICRGMQMINVAMGGDLIQDIPDLLGLDLEVHNDDLTRHVIKVRTDSWLYYLFGSEINANSTHHQCLGVVAPGLSVAAQIGPVIEAVEKGNILGVQWHPERMLDEGMLPLFEDFIKRCSYNSFITTTFSSHIIIEVEEGQYIDVQGATITLAP